MPTEYSSDSNLRKSQSAVYKDSKPSIATVAGHFNFTAAVGAIREVLDGVARHGVIALTAHTPF